jgi:hypothetical protein
MRAAKTKLGQTAKPDHEFIIIHEAGQYAWEPGVRSGLPQPEPTKHDVDAKPVKAKRKRAANGTKSSILQQPQMAAVLGLLQRKTGASVEEIAERIKCNRDTARGMVSRCKTAGAPVTSTRESRFVRYVVDSEWGK